MCLLVHLHVCELLSGKFCVITLHYLQEGSQVYKFDILTETVQLVQEVQDRQVQGAHQFIDLHDNQRYLALLNTNAQMRLYLWNSESLWCPLQNIGND